MTHLRQGHFAGACLLAAGSLALSGCAGLTTVRDVTPAGISLTGIHGTIMGGRSPIIGATVQIYQAGTSGYGAGAVGLIAGGGVTTGPTGGFQLTGRYTCAPGSYVYLVSAGGDTGTGIANSAAYLMAGLGLCDNLSASTYISMNEVTTVATVYALQSFMNGIIVGAPSTNLVGLANAFDDVNTLANIATGYAGGGNLPAGTTVPTTEIYTLANVLAGCVNTPGPSYPGCSVLFGDTTPSGGTAPVNTVEAALNIARFPANSVNSLLALLAPTAPYAPTLTSANDFTMSVTYTGAGMSAPSAVAVDASGNVWVTNSGSNTVTALKHTGVPRSGPTGYSAGALNAPSALAIDVNGNVWIANAGNSTITELTSTGDNVSGSPFSGGGLSAPMAIAFDGFGNAWVSNAGNNSASQFSSAGVALSPDGVGFPTANSGGPVGIAINPR